MKVLLFCITVLLISVSSAEIRKFTDESVIPGRYIIKLKDGVQSRDFVNTHSLRRSDEVLVPLKESVGFIYDTALNGFSAQLDENQLQALGSLPEVEFIESDQIATIDELITQNDSPWGLARTSTRSRLNPADNGYQYVYDSTGGSGSTVYVLDTGVKINHTDFGSRVSYGYNAVTEESEDDLQSHGTHVAGTAAGTTYGIAKSASIVSVKVCNVNGSCPISGVAAGVDWVAKNAKPKSVINMSLGFRALNETSAIEIAIQNVVEMGVTVVVSAGNSNDSACNQTPARLQVVITVAASDINDTAASFTNYGECVDVWAPGVNVLSDGISSINATAIKSGTSMASPHVAGLAAYLISKFDLSDPVQVKERIKCLCTEDAISGSHHQMVNSPNKLIFNGLDDTETCADSGSTSIVLPKILFLIKFFLIVKHIY